MATEDIKVNFDNSQVITGIDKIISSTEKMEKSFQKVNKTLSSMLGSFDGSSFSKAIGQITTTMNSLTKITKDFDFNFNKVISALSSINLKVSDKSINDMIERMSEKLRNSKEFEIFIKIGNPKEDMQKQLKNLLVDGITFPIKLSGVQGFVEKRGKKGASTEAGNNTGSKRNYTSTYTQAKSSLGYYAGYPNRTTNAWINKGVKFSMNPENLNQKLENEIQRIKNETQRMKARNAEARYDNYMKESRESLNWGWAAKANLAAVGGTNFKNSTNSFFQNLKGSMMQNLMSGTRGLNLQNFGQDMYTSIMGKIRQQSIDKVLAGRVTDTKGYKDYLKKNKDGTVKDYLSDDKNKKRAIAEVSSTEKGAKALAGAGFGKLLTFGTIAAAVGALVKKVKELGSASIEAYSKIEQLQTQLGVIYGSRAESDEMFGQIESYAKKSPFGVETMTQQAVLLKQSGVYGSELMDTMKQIGDISSGNNEKMRSISEVYARVLASTTVTARDMRQLANAGVPVYREMAKTLGVQQSQVRSMLQTGKVSSEAFQQMIKNLTSEGGQFYGATEVGAKTIAARKQNLSDSREMALAEIGDFFTNFLRIGYRNNSIYEAVLNIKEVLLNGVEVFVKNINTGREFDEADEILKDYSKYLEKYLNPNATTVEKNFYKKMLDKITPLAKDASETWISKGEALYQKEVTKNGKLVMPEDDTNYWGLAIELDSAYMGNNEFEQRDKAIREVLDRYGFQNTSEKDVDIKFIDDMWTIAEKSGNPKEIKKLIEKGKKKAKEKGYDVPHFLSQLIKASSSGMDINQAVIDNTRGSQTRQANAAQAWEAGQMGSYYTAQKQWYDDIDLYKKLKSSIAKYGVNGSATEFDFKNLSINELNNQFDLLVASSEKVNFAFEKLSENGAPIYTLDDEGIRLREIFSQIQDVKAAAEVSASKEGKTLSSYYTPEIAKRLGEFSDKAGLLLNQSFYSKKDIVKMAELLTNLQEAIGKDESGNGTELYKAVKRALATNTFDASKADKLVEKKSAPDWAKAISNATGIPATMVAQYGAKGSIATHYKNNIFPRQITGGIMSNLLNNGASYKNIAKLITYNDKIGGDDKITKQIDWETTLKSFENRMLLGSSSDAQTLVSEYDSQIQKLNEIFKEGLTGLGSWEELKDLPPYLKNEFDAVVNSMGDFREVTYQTVEEVRKNLNIKKFAAQLNVVFKSAIEKNSSKNLSTLLETSGMFTKAFGNSNMTRTQMNEAGKEFGESLIELYSKKIKEDDFSLKSSFSNDTLEKMNSLYKNLSINSTNEGLTEESFKELISNMKEGRLSIFDFASALDILIESLNKSTDDVVKSYQEMYKIKKEGESYNKVSKALDTIEGYDYSSQAKTIKWLDSIPNALNAFGLYTDNQSDAEYALRGGKYRDIYSYIATKGFNPNSNREMTNAYKAFTEAQNIQLPDSELNQRYGTVFSLKQRLKELNLEKEKIENDSDFGQVLDPGLRASQAEIDSFNHALSLEYEYSQLLPIIEDVEKELKKQNESNGEYEKALDLARENKNNLVTKNKQDYNSYKDEDFSQNKKFYIETGKFLQNNKDSFKNYLSTNNVSENDISNLTENLSSAENIQNLFTRLQSEYGLSLIDWLTQWYENEGTEFLIGNLINNSLESMKDTLKTDALNAFLNTSNKIGEAWYNISNSIWDSAEAGDALAESVEQALASTLQSLSATVTETGLKIAAYGAVSESPSVIAAGLALAAAGGVGNIAAGYLSAMSSDNSTTDKTAEEIERLNSLKDNLADLIQQARNDAQYYESTLRSKTSYQNNEAISIQKVNDMILTPDGAFSTSPQDYLIATKKPHELVGGSPTVNFSIVNSSGTPLTVSGSEETVNSDGSLDVKVVVDSIVQQSIADGSYNNAFAALQSNTQGNSVYA